MAFRRRLSLRVTDLEPVVSVLSPHHENEVRCGETHLGVRSSLAASSAMLGVLREYPALNSSRISSEVQVRPPTLVLADLTFLMSLSSSWKKGSNSRFAAVMMDGEETVVVSG